MLIQSSEVWKNAWNEFESARATKSKNKGSRHVLYCIFHSTIWLWTFKY